MEERQPRKLAVILHADVVGSTTLVQQNESLAHARIQDAFRRFSLTIEAYSGMAHELRGDALVAEFARASDAVSAALAFQIENTEANTRLEDDLQPRLRIGISLGEVVIADNTVTGAGVVLAQRVEQLAEPDGVCITGAIHEAVPRHLPLDYADLGKREAKGFEEPVQVYRARVKAGKQVSPPEPAVSVEVQSRTPKRLWTASAIGLLILVAGALAWWQPWKPEFEPASMERMAFPLPDKPSIAVLPFDNLSGDQKQEYFSDGMTNDIITDLSKFKNLFVIASHSTFSYKGKAVKVQQVAEELGVRYVLEGSIQRTGEKLRINAQLIDATTGHHLWAERYDRNATDFFTIQEEILQAIVASLAFQVHEAEIKRALRKDTDNLKAYDYYQRGWQAYFGYTKEANNQARELFEKAIELDPDYARAYGFLTWIHVNNSTTRYSWGEDPERSLDLALESARKAIALDPDDYFSHWALGFAYLHHREFDRALAEYERALALNPNDADLLGEMVNLLVKIGRAEQAVAQMKSAMRINPRHADWYFWNLGWAQYFVEQYDDALATLNRMSNPPNGVRRTRAAVLVRLGRLQEARAVISEYIETDLDITLEEMKANQTYKHREYLDRWIDDLRTAGLPERRPLPLPDKPSIAVLPFTNMSDDPKQEYFVDGMTEDLITDLSKLSGLFVIARNSSFIYKGKAVDVKQVSRELGVKYVLEGSVRRAGEQVRINAQLIDATTGGQLWANRYDDQLDNIFALQDRITKKIFAALAVKLSAGEQEKLGRKETYNIEAYDAFLKGWEHYRRWTPDDFRKALPFFQKAIELDPQYGRAYAAIASIYTEGYQKAWDWSHVVGVSAEAMPGLAGEYLKEALKNPTPLAHQVASKWYVILLFSEESIAEAARAIALDPNDAVGYAAMATALIYSGKPGEAIDFVDKAIRFDPHNMLNYLFTLGMAYFGMEQFQQAVSVFERAFKLNPELGLVQRAYLAAAYVHLGQEEKAMAELDKPEIKEVRELYDLYVKYEGAYYKNPEDTARLIKGLRKIGSGFP